MAGPGMAAAIIAGIVLAAEKVPPVDLDESARLRWTGTERMVVALTLDFHYADPLLEFFWHR
jgi:hypothetical protein